MAAGMPGGGQDTGGVGGRKNNASWAQIIGSTLPTRLNKNVLEIVLDKDSKGGFSVSDHDCCRVMKKLGIDPLPGGQVEAVQICPNGRGVILITLKEGVNLERFCRYDVLEVTSSGIRAVNVKPVGKREVVVTVRGLHPNTMDQVVIEYLGKFGKVVTSKVVYATYGDGPLRGLKNGDRSFKVELQPGCNIGSYHILDGTKVTLRFPGQKQTCARCHEVSTYCPGGGIAKKCEAAGGNKVELGDHILNLWKKIGYSPGDLEYAAAYDDHGEALDQVAVSSPKAVGEFTPVKVVSEPEKFSGVNIKQFPKNVDTGEVMEFLVRSGLPESNRENVVIKPNGHVSIGKLDNAVCRVLIGNIHNQRHFDRKLYCNGIIPLTPEKQVSESSTEATLPTVSAATCVGAVQCPPDLTSPASAHESLATDATLLSRQNLVSASASGQSLMCTVTAPVNVSPALNSLGSLSHIEQELNTIDYEPADDEKFLRRHSLSLRSPPPGSIAADIMSSGPILSRTRS